MAYEDSDFQAEASSLGNDAQVEWLRIHEIDGDAKLFVNGVETGDVEQGKTGDNFLLGALAAISTQPKLIEALVVAQGNGMYEFAFWRNGLKERVSVDDRIPCDPEKKVPYYGRCRSKNEMWVPLVEKAYAKFHGSYEKMMGNGFLDETLTDLTGGYSYTLESKSLKEKQDELWAILDKTTAGTTLLCATARLDNAQAPGLEEKGIRNRRTYVLLGCKESSVGKMCHVRNPWGTLEWKGKFADESSDWTEGLKSELQYQFGADGTWWMTFEDFVANFTHLTVCDLTPKSVEDKTFHAYTQEMAWEGNLCGGGLNNHDSWPFNPQIGVEADEFTEVQVILSQVHEKEGEFEGVALHGVKVLNSRLALWAAVPADFTSGEYQKKREVRMTFALEKGENVILVPSTYEAKKEGKFAVTVLSSSDKVRVMTIDSHPEDGRSTPQLWAEATKFDSERSKVADVPPVNCDHIGSAEFKMGNRTLNGIDVKQLEREMLDKCANTKDGMYEDDDFPISEKSLGKGDKVIWLRLNEIKPDYQLFCDGVGEGDIVQGSLGDCYFLGSLATVAERMDLMKQLFLVARPDKGFYIFAFWKNGEWKVVTIDDRIPCSLSSRLPKYGRGKDPREMWVPLIEKAYANLHGTYADLPGGLMSEALPDLTGGVGESHNFKRDGMDKDAVWNFIGRALKEGWLSGTSVTSEKRAAAAGGEEDEFGVGILTGHAYSILDARDCESKGHPKLLKLRNPWGKYEWTGPYADESKEWTQDLKSYLKYEFSDDGSFWIPLDEYFKYFTDISVCRMYLDEMGDIWNRYVTKGAWKDGNAGGCVNNRESYLKNPMYVVSASEKTKVVCSLYQNDPRVPKSTQGKDLHKIGLTLYDVPDAEHRLEKISKSLSQPTFEPLREAICEFEIEPGQHRLLVASTYGADLLADFTFIVYSEKPVKVADLSDGSPKDVPKNP